MLIEQFFTNCYTRTKNPNVIFGSHKILGKEKKNVEENSFIMFDFTIENIKENKT